jgi:hypothetical protein
METIPGDGVLARAAADDEDLHEKQANRLEDRKLTDRPDAGRAWRRGVNILCAELKGGTRLFR